MRRTTKRTSDERPSPAPAVPTGAGAGAADGAAILARLDAILAEQHELRRLVHRMTVVTETINLKEAARRLSRSPDTVKGLAARGIFSDGRAPENRVAGAALVFYADEIEVYRADGRAGVERLRKELGRN